MPISTLSYIFSFYEVCITFPILYMKKQKPKAKFEHMSV